MDSFITNKTGMGHKKVSDDQLIEKYEKIKNIWIVAEYFGMCGQSVHERLTRLGIKLKGAKLSNDEKEFILKNYVKFRDAGELNKMSEVMGRNKTGICRVASMLGLTDKKKPFYRKKQKRIRDLSGSNHPNWKGGVTKKGLALFDTYAGQINFCESVRRDPDNQSILQVKCAYCGKWFTPLIHAVQNRIRGLEKLDDHRFYCSDGCRSECPIFRKYKYPSGFRKNTSREVVPELRQIVFQRDGYKCQMCWAESNLHCHHIKGYAQNKMLGNDPDNCITLCKTCHQKIHKRDGCKGKDLGCGKSEKLIGMVELSKNGWEEFNGF